MAAMEVDTGVAMAVEDMPAFPAVMAEDMAVTTVAATVAGLCVADTMAADMAVAGTARGIAGGTVEGGPTGIVDGMAQVITGGIIQAMTLTGGITGAITHTGGIHIIGALR